ncbi:MAG TPA: acyl-ACP--UDP-N-acetylglucosamine O-acyltransferase [Phycisphaerae bacterium]|nr:acyl-ACP--UDP-N-acetylglucosamine O-acyltransferase [Phycisphaerae bacterium]
MPQIHPQALVENGAQLADDVIVGPYAYIGPKVELGRGCVVHHHASIEGNTTAGEKNIFFPFSAVGCIPQDLKYLGGDCRVVIGNNNRIREHATIHIGTESGGGLTEVGNDNLLMINVHVAHDCFVRNGCVIANNVMLAGHIEVQDGAVISGAAAITHFVTVGQYSFVGGVAGVVHDVPPFMAFDGHPAAVKGINRTGLKRRGFSEERLEALKTAYRLLYRQDKDKPFSFGAQELMKLYPDNSDIATLLAFIQRSAEGKFGRYRESLRGKFGAEPESGE